MAILTRPALNEVYLIAVSYVVLITFLALEIALCTTVLPLGKNDEIEGLSTVIFFTYITYALLPIRLQEAIVAGCVLTIVHFLCVVSFGNVHHVEHVSLKNSNPCRPACALPFMSCLQMWDRPSHVIASMFFSCSVILFFWFAPTWPEYSRTTPASWHSDRLSSRPGSASRRDSRLKGRTNSRSEGWNNVVRHFAWNLRRFWLFLVMFSSGETFAVGFAQARRHGNESGYRGQAEGHHVPQNLHPETRKRFHIIRRYLRIHFALGSVHGAGTRSTFKRAFCKVRKRLNNTFEAGWSSSRKISKCKLSWGLSE